MQLWVVGGGANTSHFTIIGRKEHTGAKGSRLLLATKHHRPTANDYFSALSIAASTMGAMILYPAAFGCRPSSARSFFNNPLSSTMAEK